LAVRCAFARCPIHLHLPHCSAFRSRKTFVSAMQHREAVHSEHFSRTVDAKANIAAENYVRIPLKY